MTEYIVKCGELVSVTGKMFQFPEYIDQTEEIVRCRDCQLQDDIKYCDRLGFEVGDYGFCAWAIRRDQ